MEIGVQNGPGAATAAGDELDVYVQMKLDGTKWLDVVHFKQCAGHGGAKRYVAGIASSGARTMFEGSAALAASSVRNAIGDEFRVRWVVTDASGSPSFTSSVSPGAG